MIEERKNTLGHDVLKYGGENMDFFDSVQFEEEYGICQEDVVVVQRINESMDRMIVALKERNLLTERTPEQPLRRVVAMRKGR